MSRSTVYYPPAPRSRAGPLIALLVFIGLMASGGHHGGLHLPRIHAKGGAATVAAARAVAYATAQQGKPYLYGAAGPDSYDCSGLVQAAWASAGVTIPRTSEDQWRLLRHVPAGQRRPGDLIIYTGAPLDKPPGHVTMYLGHGLMVEAYGSGVPIRITRVRPGAWGYVRP